MRLKQYRGTWPFKFSHIWKVRTSISAATGIDIDSRIAKASITTGAADVRTDTASYAQH